jgi:hypothetical protein
MAILIITMIVAAAMRQYIRTHPEFEQVGSQMLARWQRGLNRLSVDLLELSSATMPTVFCISGNVISAMRRRSPVGYHTDLFPDL